LNTQKQQLQDSTVSHKNLHHTFEARIQELESTKAELRELRGDNMQLEDRWKDTVLREGAKEAEMKKNERQNSSMSHKATEDAARISQLERELAQEKARVASNQDAQRQLEELQGLWASMNRKLAPGSPVPPGPPVLPVPTAPRHNLPSNLHSIGSPSNEQPPPYRRFNSYAPPNAAHDQRNNYPRPSPRPAVPS
jgi:hypothetical protein